MVLRPRFCTSKAIHCRGEPGLILLWIMPLVQDWSLDLLTSSPAWYQSTTNAPEISLIMEKIGTGGVWNPRIHLVYQDSLWPSRSQNLNFRQQVNCVISAEKWRTHLCTGNAIYPHCIRSSKMMITADWCIWLPCYLPIYPVYCILGQTVPIRIDNCRCMMMVHFRIQ